MKFGSGSIVSCAEDMLQWLLYNMGQLQPVSKADFNILQRQQQMGSIYNICGTKTDVCGAGQAQGPATGIGWFYPKTGVTPGRVLAKDGDVPGFTSWMGFES
jgi:beta-lactamase class C